MNSAARPTEPLDDLTRSNSLTDLAARIRKEHDGARVAAKRSLEHAIAAGELLIEAKGQLQHGQWLPWLGDHCGLPDRTARHYMRVAANKAKISEIGHVADLSLRGAIEALTQHLPPDADDNEPEWLPWLPLNPDETLIPLERVKFRPSLYPRLEFDQKVVSNYSRVIRDLPAIEINQRNELIDGRYRLEAHRKLNVPMIRVLVTEVRDDNHHLKLAIRANAIHGHGMDPDSYADVLEQINREEKLIGLTMCVNLHNFMAVAREMSPRSGMFNFYYVVNMTTLWVARLNVGWTEVVTHCLAESNGKAKPQMWRRMQASIFEYAEQRYGELRAAG